MRDDTGDPSFRGVAAYAARASRGAAAVSRDASSWAPNVDRLQVAQRDGVRGTDVAGRRLTGPVQGFGKRWQKTYATTAGPQVSPHEAIASWKAHFPEFWAKGNRSPARWPASAPVTSHWLDLTIGGGVKLSTGVYVMYAATSRSL